MTEIDVSERGTPDCLIWCLHTRPVAVEMKSPAGKVSPAQRAMREKMLKAGVIWWKARSANAAMWALAESGVRFRESVNGKRWRRPRLGNWERPRRDPAEQRPQHPQVLARRRDIHRRWRARKREREAARLAAE